MEPDSNIEQMLEDQFTLLYAQAVCEQLKEETVTYCYGCQTDHPSQTQHDCMMLTDEEKAAKNFWYALEKVDEELLLKRWNKAASTMKIPTKPFMCYKLKLYDTVWRNLFIKTDKWEEKLYKTVIKMVKLERVFSEH